MADEQAVKISALPAHSGNTIASGSLFPMTNMAGEPVTEKLTIEQLTAALSSVGGVILTATLTTSGETKTFNYGTTTTLVTTDINGLALPNGAGVAFANLNAGNTIFLFHSDNSFAAAITVRVKVTVSQITANTILLEPPVKSVNWAKGVVVLDGNNINVEY
ncbi:hypothetical protein NO2_0416 [Candidatus Termititenax persephonae]|uniref:Uncharacterized protein n=1 Tax=Candidatus Termititenax persephonae TaxID=2218525 RepID=A0A388THJ0_9BACT|nr:hypothetical protein NO2_0416 [Candidatus Termititenax persephonae]